MFIYSGKYLGKSLDNICMTCYIIPMPFKPIEPEKVRNKFWRFRVNPYQYQLLQQVGTPVQWREFCLVIAEMYRTLQSGVLKNTEGAKKGEPITIEQMNWARVIERIFMEKKSFSDEDFDEQEP